MQREFAKISQPCKFVHLLDVGDAVSMQIQNLQIGKIQQNLRKKTRKKTSNSHVDVKLYIKYCVGKWHLKLIKSNLPHKEMIFFSIECVLQCSRKKSKCIIKSHSNFKRVHTYNVNNCVCQQYRMAYYLCAPGTVLHQIYVLGS